MHRLSCARRSVFEPSRAPLPTAMNMPSQVSHPVNGFSDETSQHPSGQLAETSASAYVSLLQSQRQESSEAIKLAVSVHHIGRHSGADNIADLL